MTTTSAVSTTGLSSEPDIAPCGVPAETGPRPAPAFRITNGLAIRYVDEMTEEVFAVLAGLGLLKTLSDDVFEGMAMPASAEAMRGYAITVRSVFGTYALAALCVGTDTRPVLADGLSCALGYDRDAFKEVLLKLTQAESSAHEYASHLAALHRAAATIFALPGGRPDGWPTTTPGPETN